MPCGMVSDCTVGGFGLDRLIIPRPAFDANHFVLRIYQKRRDVVPVPVLCGV